MSADNDYFGRSPHKTNGLNMTAGLLAVTGHYTQNPNQPYFGRITGYPETIRLSSRHPWKSPNMPCTEAHPDPEMAAARPVVQLLGCSESWQIVGKLVFGRESPKRGKVRMAAYLLVI
jgi:hypothetical protein